MHFLVFAFCFSRLTSQGSSRIIISQITSELPSVSRNDDRKQSLGWRQKSMFTSQSAPSPSEKAATEPKVSFDKPTISRVSFLPGKLRKRHSIVFPAFFSLCLFRVSVWMSQSIRPFLGALMMTTLPYLLYAVFGSVIKLAGYHKFLICITFFMEQSSLPLLLSFLSLLSFSISLSHSLFICPSFLVLLTAFLSPVGFLKIQKCPF